MTRSARSANLNSGSGRARAHLYESRRGEVAVEGQSLADPKLAHQGKARGVDVGVQPPVVAPEPPPGVGAEVVVNPSHGQLPQPLHGIEELDRPAVTGLAAEERPAHAEH